MAAADLNSIRATIEGRLATELASSPAIPVVFHNMAYEPTPGSSWVQCLTSFGASRISRPRANNKFTKSNCRLVSNQHFYG